MDVRTRFFSDLYDSVSQRAYPTLLSDREARQTAYIGRLRFDTLLSRTLVLTDAQILDGAFFVDIEKDRLIERLRRSDDDPLPIEIRSRAARLKDSFMGFFKGVQRGEHLVGFHLSSVTDPSVRDELADRLASTPSVRLRRWDQVPKLLKDYGLDAGEAERLKAAWRQLFGLADQKVFSIVRWEGTPNFEFHAGDLGALKRALREPQVSGRHLEQVWTKRGSRNAVLRGLNAWEPASDTEALDRRDMVRWFNAAYNRALAHQHRCAHNFESIYQNLRGSDPLGEDPELLMLARDDPDIEVDRDLYLELPHGFIEGLGKIPSELYRSLFQQNRAQFRNWWSTGDLVALDRGIVPFINEACAHPPQFSFKHLSIEMADSATAYLPFAVVLAFGVDPITGTLAGLGVGAKGAGAYGVRYFRTLGRSAYVKSTVSQRVIEIARGRSQRDRKD